MIIVQPCRKPWISDKLIYISLSPKIDQANIILLVECNVNVCGPYNGQTHVNRLRSMHCNEMY